MNDTSDKYVLFKGQMILVTMDGATSCFAGQAYSLIRTWTTEQRRLEYASVQFELDDEEKNARATNIKWERQKIQCHRHENEIDEIENEIKFLNYRVDLHNYGERIRHVMQELDGDILGIEMEERERIGGVFAPGVKS